MGLLGGSSHTSWRVHNFECTVIGSRRSTQVRSYEVNHQVAINLLLPKPVQDDCFKWWWVYSGHRRSVSQSGNLLDISPIHTASKRTHKVAVFYTLNIEHRTQKIYVFSNRKFILWTRAVDLSFTCQENKPCSNGESRILGTQPSSYRSYLIQFTAKRL